MIPLDADFMLATAPKFKGAYAAAQAEIIAAVSPILSHTLANYSINTSFRIAHFIAHVCHESAGFRTTEEFASGAAYEGRRDLGNLNAGDGKRYKGRGLLQLTGRENYRRCGRALTIPLEENPHLAADPVVSLQIACVFWSDKRINLAADKDDLIQSTRLVNGGLNGLEDRRVILKKAKQALSAIISVSESYGKQSERPNLRRGSWSDAVAELQRMLQNAGYPLAIDNEYGPATELAVRHFQIMRKLNPSGIVDDKTWKALDGVARD